MTVKDLLRNLGLDGMMVCVSWKGVDWIFLAQDRIINGLLWIRQWTARFCAMR